VRIHSHCLDRPLVESARGHLPRRGPTVLAVTGDIDRLDAADFATDLSLAVADAVRTLVVDLTRIGSVESAAGQVLVDALLDAQGRADCGGVALLLVPDEATWRHAMNLPGGPTTHFRCYATVRDAVEARAAELSAHADLDYGVGRRPGD
jgi:ABC-type transporter Mla MlaB component